MKRHNTMRWRWALLTAALAAAASVVTASAAPVPTLFSTGVATNNPDGTPQTLIADNSPDPHYELISVPPGDTNPSVPTQAIVAIESLYPFGIWVSDDSTSKWIAPHGNEDISEPVGYYEYQTTFDLSGFNPSTAQIQGTIYSDDPLTDDLLNSTDLGAFPDNDVVGTSFSITDGFVSGINTLDFVVYNDGGPTGFRVTMTLTASAMPEPASVGMLAFAGIGVLTRRLRS